MKRVDAARTWKQKLDGTQEHDDERNEQSVRRSWKLMSRGSRQMSVVLTSKRIAQGCVNI